MTPTINYRLNVDLATLADLMEGRICREMDNVDRLRLAAVQVTIIRRRLETGVYDRPSSLRDAAREQSLN